MLGILDDVKVIELAHGLSGAFCAKLLADQGADTIKIEPPVLGEASRREPPFLGGTPNHHHLNYSLKPENSQQKHTQSGFLKKWRKT